MLGTRAGRTPRQQDAVEQREVSLPYWSPAQVVAVLGGLVLVVVGAVGLAHTGIHFSRIPTTRARVSGLHVTCLSARVGVAAGLVLVLGVTAPASSNPTTATIGVVLLAWGLIVALDPTAFTNYWAHARTDGVFYAIVGAVLFIGAVASPIFVSRRTVVMRDSTGPAHDDTRYV
jgi:hypothetical protein